MKRLLIVVIPFLASCNKEEFKEIRYSFSCDRCSVTYYWIGEKEMVLDADMTQQAQGKVFKFMMESDETPYIIVENERGRAFARISETNGPKIDSTVYDGESFILRLE